MLPLKMRVFTVNDIGREEIIAYVSTNDMEGQSINANQAQTKQ